MNRLLSVRVFTRIADAGTFVKAAESLKVPPSTVTRPKVRTVTHVFGPYPDEVAESDESTAHGIGSFVV